MTNPEKKRSILHESLVSLALLLVGILTLHPPAVADQEGTVTPDIEVVGLFKNAAVLNIEGKQRVLKVAGAPVDGVELIAADSESAVIEIDHQRHTLLLSEKMAGTFRKPEEITVSIPLNNQRQYVTTGSINDRPVKFLVDTGATIMAMNTAVAKKLGIDYASSETGHVVTAGGKVRTWRVFLSSVQVGGIKREHVEAAVLDGEYPLQILLGMTFLHHVTIKEGNGVLLLTSKF